jgi:multidrug efflux pump subunit AcrB
VDAAFAQEAAWNTDHDTFAYRRGIRSSLPRRSPVSNLAVLSLKNRALIALITIVAAVFGGLALVNLKQELIPSIELPQLAIVSTYPGASPEVVANDVSGPIETAIQGVPGLDSTSATSTTNSSIVQASFTYGTDLSTAEQKISLAINRIKSTLPTGVEPNVVSVNIDDFPVIQLAVTGYSDESTIQSRLESTTVPDIEDIAGVNAAQIVGGRGERVTITPDSAKLAQAGFTQQAITDALKQNGVLFPGGAITEDDQTLTVQTGAKLDSVDQIGALPLVPTSPAQAAAGTTTIADVATVVEARDPVTTISRVDGENALTVAVTKLPAANTVDVSKAVRAAIPDLEKKLDGAKITIVFDQAPYIQQSIDSLAQEGLLGLLFAVIIILIFLMSVRSTLVTFISIPTSVLITFIGSRSRSAVSWTTPSSSSRTSNGISSAMPRGCRRSCAACARSPRRSRHPPSRPSPSSCRSPSSATSRASCSGRSL